MWYVWPWWAWMTIGLALLITELASGTMFLIWIALAAFLAGLSALFVSSVWWVPWVVFSAASAVLIAVSRPLARAIQKAETPASNVDQLLSREAIVLVAIDPQANTGRVRVGSDEWRARCDRPVAEGEKVIVDAVQGTTLLVRPAE